MNSIDRTPPTDPVSPSPRAGIARQALASLAAVVAAVVWSHSLAGLLRLWAGASLADLAPASTGLTLVAVAVGLAAGAGLRTRGEEAGRYPVFLYAVSTACVGWGVLAALHPAAALPLASLVPVAVGVGLLAQRLFVKLPARLDEIAARHPRWATLWGVVAVLAIVQVGRLSTYMTDSESDWFVSTRHPFYVQHECLNAYLFGAELDRRGEENVYDPAHYPGLNPEAEPVTEIVGMTPEDPYQYPPPFLLLPRLAIEATHDYGAIRMVWFGLNVTLCVGALLALAAWVRGRVGTVAGLATPAVLASFPVLYDFQYGQFHFATIALSILGMLALQRRRSALGGSLLAAAILSKLFPAVLLVTLAFQRRWRDLAFTAGAGLLATGLALGVLGSEPFSAFASYHLPRLADGSAFSFGEAWPEVAMLVTAGNQGVHGIVHKLVALGVPGASAELAVPLGRLFALFLFASAAAIGLRGRTLSRPARAVSWLALLGLGSLASTGAWTDYVPLTCVWLLAFLIPMAVRRRSLMGLLVLCAVLQTTLLGTIPIGGASGAGWMLPLSLFSALAMLATFTGAVLVHGIARAPRSESVAVRVEGLEAAPR